MQRVASALASFLTVLAYLISTAPAGEDQYRNEIERWRQKRLADLKAEDGWLSVSGLFWLKSGDTTVGSDPSNDVLLPARLPGSVGSLKLAGGKVSLRVAPGVSVSRNGKPFEEGLILSDADGQADILALEDVKLILLKRGARFALRVKDNQSPLRTSFAGLRWYPPNREWRIEAKFVPYPTRSKLVLDTIVGESEEAESPGYVTFERAGQGLSASAREREEWLALVCVSRRHQRPDNPRWCAAAVRGCPQGRHRRARLQQGHQSAVRVYPVRDLSTRASPEPAESGDRGRRTQV